MKSQASRYTLVNVGGLLLDAGIVFLLTQTGLAASVAVAGGYYTAMIIVYFAHEHWSFAHKQHSLKRGAGFILIASLVGLIRIPITIIGTQMGLWLSVTWLIAVGVSFVLNYLALSWFMTRTRAS